MFALEGIRVVETGEGLAVPFAGRLFRALGADVVHIEPPGGDPLRLAGAGALFAYLNAGKRSAIIEPGDDRQLAAALAGADLWLDGRDVPAIRAARLPGGLLDGRPGLSHVAVTPFGLTGPWAGHRATGIVAASVAGFLHLCGEPDRAPLANGGYLPEFQAGLFAAIGGLTSVLAAEAGMGGQRAEVSLLETVIAFQERADIAWTHQRLEWKRTRRHEVGHPFTVFPCKGGWASIAIGTARQWENFCLLLGRPEWVNDQDLLLNRLARADDIDAVFLPWLAERTPAEVVAQCQELFIPCGPVLTAEQVMADAHLAARGFFDTLPVARLGALTVPGAPFTAEWAWAGTERAPEAGEHTAEVLQEVTLCA